MRLTPNDIAGIENKIKENRSSSKNSIQEEENEEDGEENSDAYNPCWTLRKCCSKLIDKLSHLYPQKVYEVVKPLLENDMQHQD